MTKIVVVGSLNMDLVAVAARIPAVGETLIGTQFFSTPGGKGANQAFAAARLGGSVAMLGKVGSDDFGRQLREGLSNVGCQVGHIGLTDQPTGVALIVVSATGENSIVVVPGANGTCAPIDVAGAADLIQSASVVLLQFETPLDTVVAAAQMGRAKGATVILDPAPARADLPNELLAAVDIVTPNESEAAILIGRSPRQLSVADARSIAQTLRDRGAGTVIVKLGSQGCLLHGGGESLHINAPEVVALDTTAAGDVFNGALAVALCEGASLVDASRFAVEAAALSVTRRGAQASMPSRAELDAATNRRDR